MLAWQPNPYTRSASSFKVDISTAEQFSGSDVIYGPWCVTVGQEEKRGTKIGLGLLLSSGGVGDCGAKLKRARWDTQTHTDIYIYCTHTHIHAQTL